VSERGHFISLEGGEGVGKSTQVKALAEALRQRELDVLVTREPGGSAGAEAIRELVLGGEEERWSPRAEALLFAAARADHVDKTIRPALEIGRWVLSDRFVDSSLAYQGGAGRLGIETVREINAFGIDGWYPDRTLVLILADGSDRARARDSGASDRIGGRSDDYHRKVEAAFRIIAAEEPERVQLIDAFGSPGQVTQRLLEAIADLLP
jgi:dTMP kinase